MKKLLSALLASIILAGPAFGQGAAAPSNQFLATPSSTTGFLALRNITLADVSSLLTFSNLTGSAACSQLPALTGDITSSGCTTSLPTVPVTKGGTGDTTLTANLPLIGAGTSAIVAKLVVFPDFVPWATGTLTNSHCVQIDGSGNFVDAGGTCTAGGGTVVSAGINNLAYYAAAGTSVSGLATANNGILATGATSIPAIVATLPAANFPALTGDITTTYTDWGRDGCGVHSWPWNIDADGASASS